VINPRELYQEIILDHGRRPRNFRPLPDASHSAEGKNPLCGDHVIVRLRYRDGIVEDVAFEGSGCAISTAAASTMTEAVKGKSRAEVDALFHEFHDLVTGKSATDPEELKARGVRRRQRIPHARQVCHLGMAHAPVCT